MRILILILLSQFALIFLSDSDAMAASANKPCWIQHSVLLDMMEKDLSKNKPLYPNTLNYLPDILSEESNSCTGKAYKVLADHLLADNSGNIFGRTLMLWQAMETGVTTIGNKFTEKHGTKGKAYFFILTNWENNFLPEGRKPYLTKNDGYRYCFVNGCVKLRPSSPADLLAKRIVENEQDLTGSELAKLYTIVDAEVKVEIAALARSDVYKELGSIELAANNLVGAKKWYTKAEDAAGLAKVEAKERQNLARAEAKKEAEKELQEKKAAEQDVEIAKRAEEQKMELQRQAAEMDLANKKAAAEKKLKGERDEADAAMQKKRLADLKSGKIPVTSEKDLEEKYDAKMGIGLVLSPPLTAQAGNWRIRGIIQSVHKGRFGINGTIVYCSIPNGSEVFAFKAPNSALKQLRINQTVDFAGKHISTKETYAQNAFGAQIKIYVPVFDAYEVLLY